MKVLSIDPGTRHLALCILEADITDPSGEKDRICMWQVTSTPKDVKGVLSKFQELLQGHEYDAVVLELQPPKNPSMSRFQHYLEAYFALLDKPCTVLPAKTKLTYAEKHMPKHWPKDLAAGGGWTYTKRKKLAHFTILSFVDKTVQSQEIRDVLHAANKKDDLADCALQGMAWAHVESSKPKATVPVPKPRSNTQVAKNSRYTASNTAWALKHCDTPEAIDDALLLESPLLTKGFQKYFGGDHAEFLKMYTPFRERYRLSQEEGQEQEEDAGLSDSGGSATTSHQPCV